MCNAWNHPPGCSCGFGGQGNSGRRIGRNFWQNWDYEIISFNSPNAISDFSLNGFVNYLEKYRFRYDRKVLKQHLLESGGQPQIVAAAIGIVYHGTSIYSNQSTRYDALISKANLRLGLKISVAAKISFTFGILSWTLLPFIGAIIAIVFGHQALKHIQQSNGQIGGGSRAKWGLMLGYIQIVWLILTLTIAFLLVLLGAGLH